MPRRPRSAPSPLVLVAFTAACGSSTEPSVEVPAVDVDALFAPATEDEIAAVEDAWAGRDPVAEDVREEESLVTGVAGAVATVLVLSLGSSTYPSEGSPSPWDRDVDDAMALLDAAIRTVRQADPERVGVVGVSRGGGVALLMGIRDPRVDLVVELAGPTDFLGPFVREVAGEALDGALRDLPGLAALNARVLAPLERGFLSIAAARNELIRRSAVLFAGRLPPVQVHHGALDGTVPVGEAKRLISALEALGRGPPEDEFWIYQGGFHDPRSLPESRSRTATFLARLLEPGATAPAGGR